jgi:hypothetical protein
MSVMLSHVCICDSSCYLSNHFEKKVRGDQMWVGDDLVDRSRGICKVKLWTAGRSDIVVAELVPLTTIPVLESSEFRHSYSSSISLRDKPVGLSCPPAGSGTQDLSAAYTRVANVITRTL